VEDMPGLKFPWEGKDFGREKATRGESGNAIVEEERVGPFLNRLRLKEGERMWEVAKLSAPERGL